jgi:hypothetical protein
MDYSQCHFMALGIMPSAAYDGVLKGHAMKIVETEQELRACYPVMKELRPHLHRKMRLWRRCCASMSRTTASWRWDEGEVVALAGYRYQENTVYGRFLYVDDLIAAESIAAAAGARCCSPS